jgi:hypothetical protein
MRQCAEFSFDRKSKKIILFLWLIIPNRKNKTIARMQFDTKDGYLTYHRYIPVKEGSILWEKIYRYYVVSEIENGKHKISIDETKNMVNRALKIWLERIN